MMIIVGNERRISTYFTTVTAAITDPEPGGCNSIDLPMVTIVRKKNDYGLAQQALDMQS